MFCKWRLLYNPLKQSCKYSKDFAKNAVTKSTIPTEYAEYFKSKKHLHLLPKAMFRKTSKHAETYYLAGIESAKIIANILKTLPNSECPIIEVNPGLGVLTDCLLHPKEKSANISLIEANETLFNSLRSSYGQIPCYHHDFCKIYRLSCMDKHDNGNRVSNVLNILPNKQWNDEVSSRIIVLSGSLSFYKDLIVSVSTNTGLFSRGRHEIFAVMPPTLYFLLTPTNKIGHVMYRSVSVLFQILFEFEFITKLERRDFLPWLSKPKNQRNAKLRELKQLDVNSMYLIRIIPRKNLFEFCPQNEMNMLNFFIRQNFTNRSNRVIPAIERLIPSAGKEIILANLTQKKTKLLHKNENLPKFCAQCFDLSNTEFYQDLNIFTEFGDLTPNQMLTLFNIFKNSESFKDSAFISNMELHLMKHEISQHTILEVEEEKNEADNKKQ